MSLDLLLSSENPDYYCGTGIAVSESGAIYVAGHTADNACVRKYACADGSTITNPYWIGDLPAPDPATSLVRGGEGYTNVAGWTWGDISAENAEQTDFWLHQFGPNDAPGWVIRNGTERRKTP